MRLPQRRSRRRLPQWTGAVLPKGFIGLAVRARVGKWHPLHEPATRERASSPLPSPPAPKAFGVQEERESYFLTEKILPLTTKDLAIGCFWKNSNSLRDSSRTASISSSCKTAATNDRNSGCRWAG